MVESVEILKELVKLKSENPPGITSPQIKWIESWAKDNKIPVKIQWYENNNERGNIILSLGESKRSIVLTGHLDTVPAGNITNWNFDPFGAEENDGYIYGRGTADMKGGVAACLGALRSIKEYINEDLLHGLKIVFLGTSDEEVGLGGAKAAVESGIMENVEFLIVTEPTALKVGIAEKGVLWVSIHAHGKSAHGSTPEKGTNAIEELIKLFPSLKELVPSNSHPILGQSTLNIGMISGGKSVNVVPESAEVHCDYRLIPPIDPKTFAKDIENLINSQGKYSKAKFTLKVEQIMPPVSTSQDNNYVQDFLSITKQNEVIGLNYGTDAAILASGSPNPVPFLIYGPGDPKAIHVSDEKVAINELIEVESNLLQFLKKYVKIDSIE